MVGGYQNLSCLLVNLAFGRNGLCCTRIRAADVDSRLSGSLDGEEVETDQDYALVVEEGALSATDPQGGGSPE